MTLVNYKVIPQYGFDDYGLFAIGYAIALAEGMDPAKLAFHQALMRKEYNNIIETY